MATIVNLAQNFVGSNNINVLMPIGQFGTRLQGGKDSASPRYIFTMLRLVIPICSIPNNRLQHSLVNIFLQFELFLFRCVVIWCELLSIHSQDSILFNIRVKTMCHDRTFLMVSWPDLHNCCNKCCLLDIVVLWRDMLSMHKTSRCCVTWETTTWELNRSGTFPSYQWCWWTALRASELDGVPRFRTTTCAKLWEIWGACWMESSQLTWWAVVSALVSMFCHTFELFVFSFCHCFFCRRV